MARKIANITVIVDDTKRSINLSLNVLLGIPRVKPI